jgi:hypothetical protein
LRRSVTPHLHPNAVPAPPGRILRSSRHDPARGDRTGRCINGQVSVETASHQRQHGQQRGQVLGVRNPECRQGIRIELPDVVHSHDETLRVADNGRRTWRAIGPDADTSRDGKGVILDNP